MSFCLKRSAQLFDPAAGVGNVLQVGRAKSMTEKITEGHGRRVAAGITLCFYRVS